MSEVRQVHERRPGTVALPEAQPGEIGHVVLVQGWLARGGVGIDQAGRVQPQGHAPIAPQDLLDRLAPAVIEVEGVQEDVQLVGREARVQQIVQQIHVVGRAEAVEADHPLPPDQRDIQAVGVRFVEVGLVVQEHRHVGRRPAVEAQRPGAKLLEALDPALALVHQAGVLAKGFDLEPGTAWPWVMAWAKLRW